ncbi:hypothetical protein ACVGOW_00725 [Pseudonocardia saturnea]
MTIDASRDVRVAPPSWPGRALPLVFMTAVVAVGAALPLLVDTGFYYWDDSAAVAVPWYRIIAEEVVAGRFPLLQVELWRGGNLAAEAATGFWNPLVLGTAVATLPMTNMAQVVTVMKTVFLLVMASGVYLLSRRYGAGRWPAAIVGAALPLAGYTLFVDGTAWVNGLLISAFTPWVWWAARRAVHDGGSMVWVVVAGYLCGSVGNPYGMLTAAVALGAVLVEAALCGRARRIVPLVLSGVAVVLTNVIVYLPFVLTSSVTYRSGSSQTQVANDEFLSPGLTDLLAASSPSHQPVMQMWSGLAHWTVPVTYIAWFLLPMLPWLRFDRLRDRSLTGVWIFGGVFLLLVLGPSQVWMFRWPLRLVSMLALALGVLWAVLATDGVQRTNPVRRGVLSAAIVGLGLYFAWATLPEELGRHAVAAAVVLLLTGVLVTAGVTDFRGGAVAAVGTLGVLALQLTWFPGNLSVADYGFPTQQAVLEERFDDRYRDATVQVASIDLVPAGDLRPDGAYTDLLFGSQYALAGVESLNAYSGIGFSLMDGALCMAYQGSTCANAWARMWEHPPGTDVVLADRLRVRTIVVQNALVDTRIEPAPPGWVRAETDAQVTVWQRRDPLPWPDGRLSAVGGDVTVLDDVSLSDTREDLTLDRDGGSAGPAVLTFARLAWPGYRASLDGVALPTTVGPAGLLEVRIPAGVTGTRLEVRFTPPGFEIGAAAMAAGVLLTALIGAAEWALRRRARRRAGTAGPTGDGDPTGPTGSAARPDRQPVPDRGARP